MRELPARYDLIHNWAERFGSPLHVVVPAELKRNAKDLLNAITSRGVDGGLFFARKANKLKWFVSAAKEAGLGVDIASITELQETIELGVPGGNIVVTAIGKDDRLLSKAISAGAMIIIDNADELEAVAQFAAANGQVARVGVRFAGFEVAGKTVYSRFGFPVADAASVLHAVWSKPALKLELLHAHLDKYDTVERATAARELLRLVDTGRSLGHSISAIDLGGGILMRYLEKQSEWDEFNRSLLASVRGEQPSFTWANDGFGLNFIGGQVIGQPELYPHWNEISKERFVGAVLDHTVGGTPLHKEIADRGLKLYFEPGRALLDNSGVTLARVTFRKRDTRGELLLGVAMNRFNLRPFRAEFCCDPLVVSNGAREACDEGVFVVGNLCSESDVIYRRRIKLSCMPAPGDYVLFPNSAGYLAHHLEIGTHGNPVPKNLMFDPQTGEVVHD